jgi:hypothetical protein
VPVQAPQAQQLVGLLVLQEALALLVFPLPLYRQPVVLALSLLEAQARAQGGLAPGVLLRLWGVLLASLLVLALLCLTNSQLLTPLALILLQFPQMLVVEALPL